MVEHQGQINKVTQVKLPSAIEQVMWSRAVAAPGGTVGLEVFTYHVGNGADLQIELSDGKGKKHGVFKEKIAGNRFWAPILVPPKAEQALVATVKLPRHGLEMTSAALLLTPRVEIRNAKWSKAEARRGEVLTLNAEVRGAYDGMEAELTIWEHDADGAHDLVTRLPVLVTGERVEATWEFEYHEDTDDLPTHEEAEQGYRAPEYFFRVGVGGLEAESGLLHFKDWIEIVLLDEDGQPIADEEYVLTLGDGTERKGRLGKDGTAVVKDVPPGRYEITFKTVEDVVISGA